MNNKKINIMKNLIKVSLTVVIALFLNLSFSGVQAQDNAKVAKAANKLCNSINAFITELGALDEALVAGTDKEITKSYNKAVKGYNKMIKEADKLENVEIKESVKSYNKLVDTVNKLSKDGVSDEDAKEINSHVDATAEEIGAILSATCK